MDGEALAGGAILVIGLGLVIGLSISAMFLLLGARIAGIQNRTFGKALGSVILGGIAGAILSVVLSILLPVVGTVLGFIGSFIVHALIVMSIFSTTFRMRAMSPGLRP